MSAASLSRRRCRTTGALVATHPARSHRYIMRVSGKAFASGLVLQLVFLGIIWLTPESITHTAVGIVPAVLLLMMYLFYLIPAAWIQTSLYGVGQMPVPFLVAIVIILMLLYAFLIGLTLSIFARLKDS